MSSKLFIIHGAPQLTGKIQKRVGLALSKNLEDRNELASALKNKPKSMGRFAFLKFHILNREFYGEEIPAIRFLIASGRCATQALKRVKGHFR